MYSNSSQPKSLSINLLSGLRKETKQAFYDAGITTLQQIVAMQPEDLMQFRGIKIRAYRLHAQARAYVENAPVWLSQLPVVGQRMAWHFDIETNPMTGDVWSIGWSDDNGVSGLVIVSPKNRNPTLILDNGQSVFLAPDTDSAWHIFAESVSVTGDPIFHWTNFDATVMRRTAPAAVTRTLNDRLNDLHHIYNATVQFPLSSSSLKPVAAYLGFAWQGYDDWSFAWRDYQNWCRTGDNDALSQACAYQGDDVEAMRVVLNWMRANSA